MASDDADKTRRNRGTGSTPAAAFSRYGKLDAYTLEELRREYRDASAKHRIHLLRRLSSGEGTSQSRDVIPEEIATLAVEDPSAEVRAWVARHGNYLDDRFEDTLRKDPDPFVRACLRENSTAFAWTWPDQWDAEFRTATHLERLALMRNPETKWATTLIEKIFDHEDSELGLDITQRKALVLAFLTNVAAMRWSRKLDPKDFVGNPAAGSTIYSNRTHYSKLWELTAKWPEPIGIVVYRYMGAPDETKARIYRTATDPVIRQSILSGCERRDVQTLEQGLQDDDETCREIAGSRMAQLEDEVLPPATALELFGTPRRFISEKIDFIGKWLLSLDAALRSFWRFVFWLFVVIAVASAIRWLFHVVFP